MLGKAAIHPSRRITFRLMAASLCFVLVGSLSLLAWIDHQSRANSDRLFLETARANAHFIRTGAPLTNQTAQSLSEVLQLDVHFEPPSADPAPDSQLSSDTIIPLAGNRQRVSVHVRDGYRLVLERDRPIRGGITDPR